MVFTKKKIMLNHDLFRFILGWRGYLIHDRRCWHPHQQINLIGSRGNFLLARVDTQLDQLRSALSLLVSIFSRGGYLWSFGLNHQSVSTTNKIWGKQYTAWVPGQLSNSFYLGIKKLSFLRKSVKLYTKYREQRIRRKMKKSRKKHLRLLFRFKRLRHSGKLPYSCYRFKNVQKIKLAKNFLKKIKKYVTKSFINRLSSPVKRYQPLAAKKINCSRYRFVKSGNQEKLRFLKHSNYKFRRRQQMSSLVSQQQRYVLKRFLKRVKVGHFSFFNENRINNIDYEMNNFGKLRPYKQLTENEAARPRRLRRYFFLILKVRKLLTRQQRRRRRRPYLGEQLRLGSNGILKKQLRIDYARRIRIRIKRRRSKTAFITKNRFKRCLKSFGQWLYFSRYRSKEKINKFKTNWTKKALLKLVTRKRYQSRRTRRRKIKPIKYRNNHQRWPFFFPSVVAGGSFTFKETSFLTEINCANAPFIHFHSALTSPSVTAFNVIWNSQKQSTSGFDDLFSMVWTFSYSLSLFRTLWLRLQIG